MFTYQTTSTAIGLILGAVILWLVRRDHLHGQYAMWWIGAALAVIALGAFPFVIDEISRALGISYPPVLAIILGFAMLLLKMLTMDIERSRQERQIRRLAQQLAILEAELRRQTDGSVEEQSRRLT